MITQYPKIKVKAAQERRLRQMVQIILDFMVCSAAVVIAMVTSTFSRLEPSIYFVLVAIPLLRVTINMTMGAYRKLWRYMNFSEVQNIIMNMMIIGSLLLMLPKAIVALPFEFIAKEAAMFFLLSVGLRAFFNKRSAEVKEIVNADNEKQRLLIVGAGRAAHDLIKDIKSNDSIPLNPIACLDDDKRKIGAEICGIPILDTTDRLEYHLSKLSIKTLVLAMPDVSQKVMYNLIRRSKRANVRVKFIPTLQHLTSSNEMQLQQPITIEDLLDAKEFQETAFPHTPDKNNKILITGGAGYIGVHLVKKFIDAGHKVVVLDNFTFGKSYLPDVFMHPNCEIIEGDIANIRDVVRSSKDVETIIALAAIVGDPACSISPQETLTINYESTKTLIETANFYGVKRLVFASSCSVYGASGVDSYLTEDSQLNPVSLYARTRIMSEDIIFNRCGKVEPVVLRLSTVFGYSPRMRYDLVVNTLTIRALVEKKFSVFGGRQWRPFVHCDDVAEAFFLAAKAPAKAVSHEVFNLGSTDMNYTIATVGDIVHQLIPDAVYECSDDMTDSRNYRVDFNKIQRVLQFKKKYDLIQGIEEIILKAEQSHYLKEYAQPIFSNYTTQQHVTDTA